MSAYVTVTAAAAHVGLSDATLYHWIKTGELKIYRVGASRRPRLKLADLDALMREASSARRAHTAQTLADALPRPKRPAT